MKERATEPRNLQNLASVKDVVTKEVNCQADILGAPPVVRLLTTASTLEAHSTKARTPT